MANSKRARVTDKRDPGWFWMWKTDLAKASAIGADAVAILAWIHANDDVDESSSRDGVLARIARDLRLGDEAASIAVVALKQAGLVDDSLRHL